MKKNYIKLFLFNVILMLISFYIHTQPSDPIFKLDTGGHISFVRKILVTSDKKFIISCSDDKTIRIYDAETKTEIRKILGAVSEGAKGQIYAISLSPDDRYLAAGGLLDDISPEKTGAIRLYDFKSGKLIKLLKGHIGSVTDMHYSEDGKYLVSGASDASVIVWDTVNYVQYAKYSFHDKEVYGVRIFKKNNDYYTVSAGIDGKIMLYSLYKKTLLKYFSHSKMADTLDVLIPDQSRKIFPDGLIATSGYDNVINIFDTDLNLIKTIKLETRACGLAFSKNSGLLVSGCVQEDIETDIIKEYSCIVYDIKNDFKPVNSFSKHHSTVIALKFLDDASILTGGWHDFDIYCWNAYNGSINFRLAGDGRRIWALGINGSKIAVGGIKMKYPNHQTALEKTFDLKDFTLNDNADEKNFKRISASYNEYSLSHGQGGQSNFPDAVLIIKKNGADHAKIVRQPHDGYRHKCYGFTEDGYIISGGPLGALSAYDKNGGKIADFSGHIGEVWSIAADGKTMISGGDDQIIRIWDIGSLKEIENKKTEFIDWSYFQDQYKKSIQKKYPDIDTNNSEHVRMLYNYYLKDYGIAAAETLIKIPKIFPVAAVFLSVNGEYIIWTPDNYYTGNKRLFSHIGWHINQGDDREAKYYPFEQFDLKYNRPDIIMKRLGFVSDNIIGIYYDLYKKRLNKSGYKEEQLSGKIHIPDIYIKTNAEEGITSNDSVGIQIKAVDTLFELDRINVHINNVPVYGMNGISILDKKVKTYAADITLNLLQGRNKIQISVLNTAGAESLKETVYVTCSKKAFKPDLYVAVVGISTYLNPKYNLNFADKDANDIITVFSKNKDLYNKINILNLNNSMGVLENIRRIKVFFKTGRTDDYAVLFIAGHGIRDKKNDYYFATYNIDISDPSKNGLSFDQLDQIMDGIPQIKKLLMIDTCFSGEKDEDTPDMIALKKMIFSDIRNGTGTTVISSSSSTEYSYEGGNISNGIFSYSVIEGLTNKTADKNKDNKVQISELMNYVFKAVLHYTEGLQTPMISRENIEYDYVIY